ncbi:hypothetical protein CGJ72_25060 [Vibrio parahaemolyticus]|nr:hypothetical protein CGJ72_25060 [Vibrio parahaemolyticus]
MNLVIKVVFGNIGIALLTP